MKRYKPTLRNTPSSSTSINMMEADEGPWVRYTDVFSLFREIDSLESQVRNNIPKPAIITILRRLKGDIIAT